MTRLWTRLLESGRVPHAQYVSPLVMEKCAAARGAIGTAFAYTDSQMPFACAVAG